MDNISQSALSVCLKSVTKLVGLTLSVKFNQDQSKNWSGLPMAPSVQEPAAMAM